MGTLGKPGKFRYMWHDIVSEWQKRNQTSDPRFIPKFCKCALLNPHSSGNWDLQIL